MLIKYYDNKRILLVYIVIDIYQNMLFSSCFFIFFILIRNIDISIFFFEKKLMIIFCPSILTEIDKHPMGVKYLNMTWMVASLFGFKRIVEIVRLYPPFKDMPLINFSAMDSAEDLCNYRSFKIAAPIIQSADYDTTSSKIATFSHFFGDEISQDSKNDKDKNAVNGTDGEVDPAVSALEHELEIHRIRQRQQQKQQEKHRMFNHNPSVQNDLINKKREIIIETTDDQSETGLVTIKRTPNNILEFNDVLPKRRKVDLTSEEFPYHGNNENRFNYAELRPAEDFQHSVTTGKNVNSSSSSSSSSDNPSSKRGLRNMDSGLMPSGVKLYCDFGASESNSTSSSTTTITNDSSRRQKSYQQLEDSQAVIYADIPGKYL